MVPKAGLEPARYFYQGCLRPLRLPVSPFGQMAESVGFEPTDAYTSSDFKSGALNRTLPTLHMAGTSGFEPLTYGGVKVRCVEPLRQVPIQYISF